MTNDPDANFSPAIQAFNRLLEVMAQLRSPQGCPWDKKQTHESLKACLLEETYEVLGAIDSKDARHLREELGDLLLQVVFHSQIASEAGEFNMETIIHNLVEKLTRRHPHVFGGEKIEQAEEAISRWEHIKAQEKQGQEGLFSGVPKELPALFRAFRIGGKASRVGFDWPQVEDIWKKAEEEIEEIRDAMVGENQQAIEEEWGDLFFTLAQVARRLKVNPEEALRISTEKFEQRLAFMEKKLLAAGIKLHEVSAAQWDSLWEEAKSFTESV